MPQHTELPLSARQALSRYWRFLLPLAVFQPLVRLAAQLFGDDLELIFLLSAVGFFASMAPPMWLLLARRVRYSFWFVSVGVFFASGLATGILNSAVRFMVNFAN